MDSILDKLTEIENAASAIVRHAEEQKDVLDQEFDEKRKKFDEELENKTRLALRRSGSSWKKNSRVFLTAAAGQVRIRSAVFRKNIKRSIQSMPMKY